MTLAMDASGEVPGKEGANAGPVLQVDDLAIEFGRGKHRVEVVRSASFVVGNGEILGLVGESGSGKTVTSLAAMGLVPVLGGQITRGRIMFRGQDVTDLPQRAWRELRGPRIGMVFQQPMRSLNPALTVGEQIAESVRRHLGWSRRAAWNRAVELLDRVDVRNARQRARDFPHQFSGGMCQRVMIAMALACEPDLLIADEPTTALDVTVQAKILGLLEEIIAETGVSVLYISHDLAVIAQLCNRVAVMYAGEVVEEGPVPETFRRPKHPYTTGLIRSVPRLGSTERLVGIPGRVPSPHDMPNGCRFSTRCTHVVSGHCDVAPLALERVGDDHSVRCIRHEELGQELVP